jgi:hypothetical protein
LYAIISKKLSCPNSLFFKLTPAYNLYQYLGTFSTQ